MTSESSESCVFYSPGGSLSLGCLRRAVAPVKARSEKGGLRAQRLLVACGQYKPEGRQWTLELAASYLHSCLGE